MKGKKEERKEIKTEEKKERKNERNEDSYLELRQIKPSSTIYKPTLQLFNLNHRSHCKKNLNDSHF